MHLPVSSFDDFETAKKEPNVMFLVVFCSETTHEHHLFWLVLFGKKFLMAVLKE
jgi:hypothetical protein